MAANHAPFLLCYTCGNHIVLCSFFFFIPYYSYSTFHIPYFCPLSLSISIINCFFKVDKIAPSQTFVDTKKVGPGIKAPLSFNKPCLFCPNCHFVFSGRVWLLGYFLLSIVIWNKDTCQLWEEREVESYGRVEKRWEERDETVRNRHINNRHFQQ